MSAPQFASVDDETADLLGLIADDPRVEADYERFLNACRACADLCSGLVYVNKVRDLLTDDWGDLIIRPQRLSAFWSKAGREMRFVKTGEWQVCKGSGSGNDGRPQPVRRWVG